MESCRKPLVTVTTRRVTGGFADAARWGVEACDKAMKRAITGVGFMWPPERSRRGLVVPVGVLAARKVLEEHVSGPTELAHPLLGRIVRAHDPALQILETVPERRRCRRWSRAPDALARLPVLCLARGPLGRGRSKERELLALLEGLPGMPVAGYGFPFEDRERVQELALVLLGVDSEKLVDERCDLRLRRPRKDPLRERRERLELVAIQEFGLVQGRVRLGVG